MNRDEATRIAGAVNALRPDWGVSGLMTILGDDRNRGRAYADMVRVFVALAIDPKSEKPTRIYEDGPWWHAAMPRPSEHNTSAHIRRPASDDCEICGRPKQHAHLDHRYEPRHSRGHGVKPPQQVRDLLTNPKENAMTDSSDR